MPSRNGIGVVEACSSSRSWRSLPSLAAPGAWAQGAASADLVARGKYVFGATGGCGCHTEKDRPVNSGGRKLRGAVRDRLLLEHHAGPADGDRRLDGRADHHGDPSRPSAERRAADPGAPVSRVQRHGRGGPPRPGGVPPTLPAVNRPNTAEEDHRAAVRERVPPGLARGLRAARDACRRPRPPRGGPRRVPACARSGTAVSATRRAA